VGSISDRSFDPLRPELADVRKAFPVLNEEAGNRMLDAICDAKSQGDSLGGVIECAVTGLPAGLGDPMFGGMESRIAQIVYGIPAVKGVEFGAGFAAAAMLGSDNNDAFTMKNGQIQTVTNHAGGILGGITNGMPLVFSVAIKPTPSIQKQQQTVSIRQKEVTPLVINGRHDPCIAPRAVPVVEAAAAIAIFDAYLAFCGSKWEVK
jgi:chorismate synthase